MNYLQTSGWMMGRSRARGYLLMVSLLGLFCNASLGSTAALQDCMLGQEQKMASTEAQNANEVEELSCLKVAGLSTAEPQGCGIATFVGRLGDAVRLHVKQMKIAAISDHVDLPYDKKNRTVGF